MLRNITVFIVYYKIGIYKQPKEQDCIYFYVISYFGFYLASILPDI